MGRISAALLPDFIRAVPKFPTNMLFFTFYFLLHYQFSYLIACPIKKGQAFLKSTVQLTG